jgi:hypothetical protein
VLHVLGEYEVTYEQLYPLAIEGESPSSIYILRRKHDGALLVYSGVFGGPNEYVLPAVLENICRRLELDYDEIFGS